MTQQQNYDPQKFESYARQGVVNISDIFFKRGIKIHATSFAMNISALGSLFFLPPVAVLIVPPLLLAATLYHTRRQHKQLQEGYNEIMEAVPQQAQGIVGHELRNLDKPLKSLSTAFTTADIDPRKNMLKTGATIITSLVAPQLAIPVYLSMTLGDDAQKTKLFIRSAFEARKANQAAPV